MSPAVGVVFTALVGNTTFTWLPGRGGLARDRVAPHSSVGAGAVLVLDNTLHHVHEDVGRLLADHPFTRLGPELGTRQ